MVSAYRQATARRLLQVVTRCSLVALLLLSANCDGRVPSNEPVPRPEVQQAAQTSPELILTGRVTDAAKILSDTQDLSLSQQLESFERVTQHQMTVVTVQTLGGEVIAAFTRDLGNAWGVGRTKEDDGVILLVAPNERQVRIAVGYGLEGILSEEACQHIMIQDIILHFRDADLPEGIEAGISALVARLRH
jgi:uncharacterized protein